MSLTELFSSGQIVDAILLLIVLEGLLLAGLYYYKGKGLKPVPFIVHTLPGVFIFLALRAALTDADWQMIAVLLAASFLAHIVDLFMLIKSRA